MQITAAITTYKRDWKTIERAVKSIEDQTLLPDEILLIDDNHPNTKYTAAILAGLKSHPDVTYISVGKNQGVAGARNLALKTATGPYIAFIDDDDEWVPEKLEVQTELLSEHPNAAIIFGLGVNLNDRTGEKTDVWQSGIFKEHPSYEDELAHDHIGSTSCPLINLDAAKKAGFFPAQPAVEDYALWLNIMKEHEAYGTEKRLFIRHMDSGEHVSTNHKNTYMGYKKIYREHKEDYENNKNALVWIMYNIMREGIKAKQVSVIPYFFKWLFCSLAV